MARALAWTARGVGFNPQLALLFSLYFGLFAKEYSLFSIQINN